MDTPTLRSEGSFPVPKCFYHLQNEFQQRGREMGMVPFWRAVEAKCRSFSQDRLFLALVQFPGKWTERSLISSSPLQLCLGFNKRTRWFKGRKKKGRKFSSLLSCLCSLEQKLGFAAEGRSSTSQMEVEHQGWCPKCSAALQNSGNGPKTSQVNFHSDKQEVI